MELSNEEYEFFLKEKFFMKIPAMEKRKEIFNDTKKLCTEHPKLVESIKKSVSKQKCIEEKIHFTENNDSQNNQKAEIIIYENRTFYAASKYAQKGMKTCVLNFADFFNAGGYVEFGASSQEESLCRCSTLYFCLNDKEIKKSFYENHKKLQEEKKIDFRYNDDCIWTPQVTVFKSDTESPVLMEEKDWFYVDVITCAAPNVAKKTKATLMTKGELYVILKKRFKRILEIAKHNKEDALILGAFGCGAFGNPPEIVALAASAALKDFESDFKAVEFAIYSKTKRWNYEEFRRVFMT